ncbi:MAG: nicotinamide riboside transporter PnuC [Pedobacter sp.]|nr:MAG: nicotinamide riboside transporter PnuC [Pedobacter sp.]
MDFLARLQESLGQFIFHTSPLEWLGVITGTLCVWLAAKNNIWNWPIAVVSVVCYIFIFKESKLYADMGLQFYFLIMNIYGWYYWSKQGTTITKPVEIRSIKLNEIAYSIAGVALFTYLLGTFLYQKTDAHFPFIDSFCTACSLIAQLFLARKIIQNWLIWILVDLIYIGVYFSKDLYATALMYTLYIIIATIGYLDWRKIYKQQQSLT